jgi:hypothetical protein
MITSEEVNIETIDNSTIHKDLTNRNLIIETNKHLIRGDSIKIQGFVDIKNGDTHIKGKNKFTQSILKHIMNLLSNGHNSSISNMYFGCYSYTMYIGSNTATPTLYNTTVLVSPIGTTPGTAPNILSGSATNPSAGIFKITITATWNPNIVSGTVGEMALYLNSFDTLQTFGWTTGMPASGNKLVSRLSVADGDFSAFTITTSNPLVIVWTIQLSF